MVKAPLEFSQSNALTQDGMETSVAQENVSNAQLQQAQTSSSHVHNQQQPGLEVDLPLMTFFSQKHPRSSLDQESQLHEMPAPTSQYHTSVGLQQPLQPDSYEPLFAASQPTTARSPPNPFDDIHLAYQQSTFNQLHKPPQDYDFQALADDTRSQLAQPVQQQVAGAPSSDMETTHQIPSIQPALSSQPSHDQAIPFDDRLSGPSSPVFDREMVGPYIVGDAARHSSSYSIMELSSELAQTPYFSQARQSPLFQEHLQTTSAGTSSLSDSTYWKPAPVEAETEIGAFDQVSLSEDVAGSTPSAPEVHSPPVRERGLASLLDPQTLSAVEDLLNMPKSAAFERGMSRLFKGVKSSATSIFASPLTQSQAKPVESLDEPAVKMDSVAQRESGISAAALPQKDTPPDASANVSSTFTAHGISQGGQIPETGATPEPRTEVLSSDPIVDHWGAPSATSKNPGSAHDLLALIAKSSEDPQQATDTPALLKGFSFAEAMEPTHVTESDNNAPHPEHHVPGPDYHVPEPEHHIPEPEHHVPTPEYHVPEPKHHMPEPEHRMPEPEHHVPTPEYNVPKPEYQVPEPYHRTLELDHRKPEPEHGFSDVASSGPAVSTYTHATTDAQEIQLPSTSRTETKTDSTPALVEKEEEEVRANHFDYSETSTHSHSQAVAEQNTGQPIEPPVHAHHSFTPDHGKQHHHVPVSPVLPRASSPSVLDREVLLKKQAAVSALQAAGGGVRARPDKKERLLEKARELLEKRQQNTASQLNNSSGRYHQSARPTSPLMRSSVLSDYEPRYSSESERHLRPGSTRPSMESNRASMDFAGGESSSHGPIATASHAAPPLSPAAMPSIHATISNAPDASAIHTLQAENDQLKQQIQTMSAQFRTLESNAANAELLKAQHEEMRHQIAQMHASLAEANTAQQQSLWNYTRQLESIQDENSRLQAELEQARHHVQDHSSSMTRCERLEAELAQMRLRCQEYETATTELERLTSVRQENERLRQELQDAQQQLLRDNRSHLSSSPFTISSDGVMYSPEQLSKEAEGLRRQLKGQRDEMKEWQERVKRSETERRDLYAKIEHLERSLADADKHRNEQKTHQAMKDEAYKVIQERLVASFEEEKAQYMDEEAFKMVKLEHRYNLVKEELEALRAKSAEDDQKLKEEAQRQAEERESAQVQAMLEEQNALKGSVTQLQEHILQLESDLDAARKSETAAQELKKSEELWKASVVAVENQRIALQKELDDCKALLDDRNRSGTATSEDREKELQEMVALTTALELSRKREQELKKELELASQTIKESALMQRRSSVDKDQSMHHQIELDRLSELAAKQQENLIAAQEERMHTEDLLQRAQIELMAARAEISQLEATLQSSSAGNSPDADLQQEMEETRQNVLTLQNALRERDELLRELRSQQKESSGDKAELLHQEQIWTDRVSDLTLQLENAVAASQELQQRLEHVDRSLQGSISTSTAASADLEAQVHTLTEQLDQSEKQLERARNLLLEKQREVEQTSLELESFKHQTAVAERELEQLRLRNSDDEQHLERSTASAQVLEEKLEEEVEKGCKLESALAALQKERQALGDQ
ncbi:hypothetical protein BGZ68_001278, partial [Mortierella alpina]